MVIRLNGQNIETNAQSVAQLLESLHISPIGVAVAVNEQVVRRAAHTDHKLSAGDVVEVIRAVQGG